MRLALRRRKGAALPMSPDETRAAWQCASVLIGYPDEKVLGHLPTLREVAAALPPAAGTPLLRLIDDLAAAQAAGDAEPLRRQYVATFDYTRRCAPYLTYFSYGDTRKRGAALVAFKQAYRRAGVELADADAELPDHLGVVLEFGASADMAEALRLLLEHRAGLEVLRLALLEADSRWADAVVAVCATLPPLDGDETAAIARLVAQGPPSEDVGAGGLTPYGDPATYGTSDLALDPRLQAQLNPHPADDVPWRGDPATTDGPIPTYEPAPTSEGARS